jgi:drug/metabolite transporter (DMT)-like permease
MVSSTAQSAHSEKKGASTASIILAFAAVYFFWGSTYTAIRIGAADMPALLFAGTRFLIAGAILLAWCRFRGLRIVWPFREMMIFCAVGLLLLGCGNVGLVYAEKTMPSGLSSLVLAVIPLMVALIEMLLPGGEPLPARGWLGMVLGFGGLIALVWPSIQSGITGDRTLLLALAALLGGGVCWAVGSVLSRRARLQANSFVAAAWQMVFAGIVSVAIGSAMGEWPQFHLTPGALGSLAYLITGGSLIGYTAFIYLLEHVPVSKVVSHSYINPVVAVILGILVLKERPQAAEFIGMAGVIVAVYLLTSARIKKQERSG